MNCKGPCGLVHNIGPCFDIVFAQLEVIPKTRNKFVEIVAVAGRYLIAAHVKKQRIKEAAVANMPFCHIIPWLMKEYQ